MSHDELEGAVPLYAVGALERVERQALEAHLLSGCIPCYARLKEYQSVAMALPFGLTITPPPRALKGKIMSSRLSPPTTESETHPRSKPSLEPGEWMNHLFPPSSTPATSYAWALGTILFAVLLIVMLFGWNSSTQMAENMEKLAQLQSQVNETSTMLATLKQQLSERTELLVQTREELQRRMAELAEVKNQLIQRETELDELKVLLIQGSGTSARVP